MLPRSGRLTRGADLTAVVRAGRRAGGRLVVVHLHVPQSAHGPARAGFVVSRAVGDAVVRNRVKRRLRHLVAARLDALPAGSMLVVRALPASAAASSVELSAGVDTGLRRAAAPAPVRGS